MIDREKCCGCGACLNICPRKCISMVEDELGFSYPNVDKSNCIDCGLCEKVCPAVNEATPEKEENLTVYGGYANDVSIRKASSSGGFFSLIALYVLSNNGVVFGAALDHDCSGVSHIKISTPEQLAFLQGSKYVQSKTHEIYKEVKDELNSGKYVLFSGTPCQIRGLTLFLQKKYEKLLTVELICHGTPAPRIFKKYVSEMTRKLKAVITDITFRNEWGGSNLIMKIRTTNEEKYKNDIYSDPYYRLFLSNTCLRESCYKCTSKGLNQRADITLGDFWGVEYTAPELCDGGSISLLIAHNEKAKEVLKQIIPQTTGREFEFENAIEGNQAFFKSCERPIKRNSIAEDLNRYSLEKLVRKYTYTPKAVLKLILHKLGLSEQIKKILKGLIHRIS